MTKDEAVQILLDEFDAGTKNADTMLLCFPSEKGKEIHESWLLDRTIKRAQIVGALGETLQA